MASIATDAGGRRRILFVAEDGSRRTIRLGKVDLKIAQSVCRHVEALLAARLSGQPISRETAVWLASVGEMLRGKLARVGLVEASQRLTVGEFLKDWLAAKRAMGHKATSLRAWGQTAADLIRHFGPRPLASLSHTDGEAFRAAMQTRGLRTTTIHKRLGHARQMLEDAARQGHVVSNPWRHVRHRGGDPSERRAYVPITDVERVIEHCPNVWWKLLVALARFGGLRVPSEAFSLNWGDVDWERGRLTVSSTKTERQGKPYRVIPLFPLLRPHLEAAFEVAREGSVHVFPEDWRARAAGKDGWAGANFRTTFAKIVRRAGVEPWPRLWHSMRASCESDLAQSFPLATVTKWLGNTPSVALRHYVDPTETAFTQALEWTPKSGAKSGAPEAQKPAQQNSAGNRDISHPQSQEQDSEGVMRDPATLREIVNKSIRECKGIEPSSYSTGNSTDFTESGAKSGALALEDTQLDFVIRSWPKLSQPQRTAIARLVRLALEGEA